MSERVYKLLNGSELLVSEEVMGVRIPPDGMPITVDGDYVIDDVLKLVDVGNEAARELEYAKKQAGIWNDEAVRLRKELEEVHTYRKSMVKLMRDVTDILSMSNPASPDVALERIYRWLEENKPVGQEGEGNQDAQS